MDVEVRLLTFFECLSKTMEFLIFVLIGQNAQTAVHFKLR